MIYPSIRIEGSILSHDIVDKLDDAPGQRPTDFGFESSVKVKDEIARAWADAQDYWRIFQRKLETIREDSPATTETRNNWIVPLLGLLGYHLEYQSRGIVLNGKTYAISHRVINKGQTPVHITGYREPAGLDRKPEKAVLRMSAHAMLQEFLNLHDELYGLVTNGRVLRLLRDSSRLIKLSYLEFDLDRIFTDGLFADFAILYRLLHASRLPQTIEGSSQCWIERYHQDTIEQGTRIRDGLRAAVTEALELLGTGFLAHPDNGALREQIISGALGADTYFNHLLRLVYRLLFLMVAEERGLVFPKDASRASIRIYQEHYSVQRLRRLSVVPGLKTNRAHDGWMALLSTFHIFETPDTAQKMGTTALGGQLFHPDSLGPLHTSSLSNAALFTALDRLCHFNHPKSGQRMPVNFGALATEEFGSVYESLLELHPVVEVVHGPRFGFKEAAGNERKTSGSYYTPASLVDCLLDSALNPVLDDRIKNFKSLGYASVEEAVLNLKVCDPACGSGHFLIAAAQRIARRLAFLRAGDEEPSPDLLRHTLREVIGHCIYGVDINPMSVELCKVGLWLEALEPGKPLSFLDHHIQCGNSLLGATPELLEKGIPDEAFGPIEGDDRAYCSKYKKQNKDERQSKQMYLEQAAPWESLGNLAAALYDLDTINDDTIEGVQRKQERYAEIVRSSGYLFGRLFADAWCAAFVWKKRRDENLPFPVTEGIFRRIEKNPHWTPDWMREEIQRLATQYRFFHWHLAFPEVFRPQSSIKSGFDVILGNPPWERVKLQEKEFFSERSPEIANAPNANARKKLIEAVKRSHPELHAAFLEAARQAEGQSHLLRNSGLFPLCGRGDVNTYTVFAELMRRVVSHTGCIGVVVPSGIATDDTTKYFFQDIVETRSLVSLYDFENREGLFPAVDSRMKFCLLTLRAPDSLPPSSLTHSDFVFFAHAVEDLRDPERSFTLTHEDIVLLNPNTRTCPIFRSIHDAELTKAIYRRVPVLIREAQGNLPEENPWKIKFGTMFHMSNDSHLFRTREQLEQNGGLLICNVFHKGGEKYLPLYEAKMATLCDHRSARVIRSDTAAIRQAQPEYLSSEEHESADIYATPLYWVKQSAVRESTPEFWQRRWTPGWRRVTATTNERSFLQTMFPDAAFGDSIFLMYTGEAATSAPVMLSGLATFVFDYVVRQKVGGLNLSFFLVAQLPVHLPNLFLQPCPWHTHSCSLQDWLLPRILELTYTAWDLESFAEDCGWSGPPFRWDYERRFLLRGELDAAFFHLYLGTEEEWQKQPDTLSKAFPTPRHAVDYIMDTFPIVKRKDEAAHGTYRTKDTILQIYDAMQHAIATGKPYKTLLDPPPADPSCCHPPREERETTGSSETCP